MKAEIGDIKVEGTAAEISEFYRSHLKAPATIKPKRTYRKKRKSMRWTSSEDNYVANSGKTARQCAINLKRTRVAVYARRMHLRRLNKDEIR